jgi:hypothetical protein
VVRSNNTTHLVEVLRALPASELAGLVRRLGIRIDGAKRLDEPSQVARALVQLPELRDPSRLPPASVELLHRVAEARGTLQAVAVPPAMEPLAARGLMFARGVRGAVELVLPTAFLFLLRPWDGEDPRGARALLAQASFEATSAIAGHYLGRPANPPIALALEPAWDVLANPSALAAEIEKLAPSERRVLEAIEREGGEVDTEELLELEREPLRLRTATGVSPSRRGVGSALERRAFLVPVHPNRHVVPTEVSRIVGASRHAERASRREKVKRFVVSGDHAPNRARFARDPGPLAMALALVAREPGVDVRSGIGTPKSLVQKLAARFGADAAHTGLLVALSRAVGLWEPSALATTSPPGMNHVGELPGLLFETWRRGGAWDEARVEPEVMRLPADARDPSPVGAMRELVMEALVELGEGWIPWVSLFGFFRTDHRMPGLRRLFRRWAERGGVDVVDPLEVARRVVLESLPALGVLDLGDDELLADEAPDSSVQRDDLPDRVQAELERDRMVCVRLTPRGRSLVAGRRLSSDGAASRFVDSHVLRVAPSARIAAVLGLAALAEVGRAQETLDLVVAPQTIAKALGAGIEADAVKQRIAAVAELPEGLSKTLEQASVVVGRGTYTPASAFLWVEDGNVRELLRTRRGTQDLFVDPSPPGGLLVVGGGEIERLVRRCRAVGVEIELDGQVLRAHSMPPPAVSGTTRIPSTQIRLTPGKGSPRVREKG